MSFLRSIATCCVLSIAFVNIPAAFAQDPDIPDFARFKIDKEQFLSLRAEAVGLRRGMAVDGADPRTRINAIKQMEAQEAALRAGTNRALLAAWTPLGPAPIPNGQTSPTAPVSGRVISVAIHPSNPDIVYVGTAQGGLYRSTNGGNNWVALMDGALSLAIGALALAPTNPEILYVGTGEPNFSIDSFFGVGVYRVENASTAASLNGPFGEADFGGRGIGEIIVDPTDADTIFVASTSGLGGLRPVPSNFPPRGVYRSTNGTSATPTFTRIGPSAPHLNTSIRDMAIDPDDANILVVNAVANGGGIYRSTDALAATPTFTLVETFNGGTSDVTAEFASIHPMGDIDATFYAATGNGGGRVLRSTDGGATWAQQIDNNFCGGQCFYDIAVAVDPSNASNVYLGGDPTLIFGRSTNAGASFTSISAGLHVDTHVIEVSESNPSVIYLGTDGGIYKSIDAGLTFLNLNNTEFDATQFMSIALHPTDANFSIGGTQDNGTNHYQSAGTWNRIDFGDGGFAQIDQNAADIVNVRMYHTYFNSSGLQGYGTVGSTALASDGNWTFRGCQFGGATMNGITCNGVVNFYAPLERGPGNPNTIYYGSDRLYRSSDLGVNHTVVSQNPIESGIPISSIGISPQNDNVRIVGLNNGGLYGTSTGSSTLDNLDPLDTVPLAPINRTVIDPASTTTAYVTLSVFGVDSIWKTTNLADNPPTWASFSSGLPQVPVNALVVDPFDSNNVFAGTDIGVYVSQDAGATWLPFGTGLPRVAVFGMAIHPVTRTLRIATHGRGMWENSGNPLPVELQYFTTD